MKNRILVTLLLVVILVGTVTLGIFAVISPETKTYPYSTVSDKVTAPDPNWPTPEELAKGQEALQRLIEQSK